MPSQHGVHDWIRKGNVDSKDDHAIEYLRGMTAYTEVLARHGYVCGLSGKWHMGDSARPQKGFAHWFAHQTGGSNYHGAPMIRDGKPYNEPRYVTDVITDEALEFLDKQKGANRPFYLSVHYTAPHSPWVGQHPENIVGSYNDCPFTSCPDVGCHPWQINSAPRGTGQQRREILKGYFAAVTAMDLNVGRILDKLEEAGIRENTLILFTSDNGMNMGHHGIFGKGNGTFPANMYDTSVKVPAIISLPSRCPQGVVEQGLYSHYDFMPTLLDYLGMEHPDAAKLPGRSFAPLLRGEGMAGANSVVVFDEYGPTRMIRDRRWKYVHRYPYGPNELYSLSEDPEEKNNLIKDAAFEKVGRTLKAGLEEFFVRYSAPALDGSREPVYGTGQLDLAGPAGKGNKAFWSEFRYVDENGRPRPAEYRPAGL
jgi:arylsulfatase A-like enzyme